MTKHVVEAILGHLYTTSLYYLASFAGGLSHGTRQGVLVSEHSVLIELSRLMYLSTAPSSDQVIPPEALPPVVISASIAVIYLADRTGFWLKEQKQFNPYTFAFLSLLTLAIGLLTVRRAENDLGFLNRDQTDEWKGWMQST